MPRASVILLALLALACEPPGVTPAGDEQANVLKTMVFQRHANGLCFGMVKFYTHGGNAVVSIVHVPDSACPTAEAAKTAPQYSPTITWTRPPTTWEDAAIYKDLVVWRNNQTLIITDQFPVRSDVCFEGGGHSVCHLAQTWQALGELR